MNHRRHWRHRGCAGRWHEANSLGVKTQRIVRPIGAAFAVLLTMAVRAVPQPVDSYPSN